MSPIGDGVADVLVVGEVASDRVPIDESRGDDGDQFQPSDPVPKSHLLTDERVGG